MLVAIGVTGNVENLWGPKLGSQLLARPGERDPLDEMAGGVLVILIALPGNSGQLGHRPCRFRGLPQQDEGFGQQELVVSHEPPIGWVLGVGLQGGLLVPDGALHQLPGLGRLSALQQSHGQVVLNAPQRVRVVRILRVLLDQLFQLGLDCRDGARLIIDLEGKPFPADRLQAHYEAARTMRVALEANSSFCRALMSLRHLADVPPSRR